MTRRGALSRLSRISPRPSSRKGEALSGIVTHLKSLAFYDPGSRFAWPGRLRSVGQISEVCLGLVLAMALFGFPAHGSLAAEAYISNEKSNTVSVIDTDKREVTKTIKVGQRPRGIVMSKDGKFVAVAVGDDDTIQTIDTASKEVTGTLPSGPDPELLAFSPNGKTLYVANENDNTVTVIDVPSRAAVGEVPVGVEPEGMGISPDGKTVVCTSETSNMAHFIDIQSKDIVANVLVKFKATLCRVQEGRIGTLGLRRGWWYGQHHRSRQACRDQENNFRHPRA